MDEEFIKECEKLGIKFSSSKTSTKIIESDFYEIELINESYKNNIILWVRYNNSSFANIIQDKFPSLNPLIDTNNDGILTFTYSSVIITPNDLLKKLKQLREMREFLEVVFDFAKNYKRKMNPLTGE